MNWLVDNVIDAAVVVAVAYVFYAAATEPVDPPVPEPSAAVSTACEDSAAARPESSPSGPMPAHPRQAAFLFLTSERDEP
jgi:hypothetical protein